MSAQHGKRSILKLKHKLCYRPQAKFAKVMFLHMFVILSTGCLQAHTQGGSLRGLASGGPRPRPGGSCVSHAVSQHALRQTPFQQTATAADTTHPTGMHLCFTLYSLAERGTEGGRRGSRGHGPVKISHKKDGHRS